MSHAPTSQPLARKQRGQTAGGQFDKHTRADGAALGTGRSYPTTYTPTADQMTRAAHAADRQIGWGHAAPESREDLTDSISYRLAEQEAAYTAWTLGEAHPDDERFARIWSGEDAGFTASEAEEELERARLLRHELDAGRTPPRVAATLASGDADLYLDQKIELYTRALRCGGRNLSINQANVVQANRLADAAPPF